MGNAANLAKEVLMDIDRDRQSFVSLDVRRLLIRAANEGPADPHAEEARRLIDEERRRQDAKWGEQNHDPQVWMAILGEKFGELCQAANDLRWGKPVEKQNVDPWTHALNEAVQTAAVSKAIVECLLRAAWQWPRKPSSHDGSKRYVIMSQDFGPDMYMGLPSSLPSKTRNIAWTQGISDSTLIGTGEECEAMVALLSGVCGTSGMKVVEVPHA